MIIFVKIGTSIFLLSTSCKIFFSSSKFDVFWILEYSRLFCFSSLVNDSTFIPSFDSGISIVPFCFFCKVIMRHVKWFLIYYKIMVALYYFILIFFFFLS